MTPKDILFAGGIAAAFLQGFLADGGQASANIYFVSVDDMVERAHEAHLESSDPAEAMLLTAEFVDAIKIAVADVQSDLGSATIFEADAVLAGDAYDLTDVVYDRAMAARSAEAAPQIRKMVEVRHAQSR